MPCGQYGPRESKSFPLFPSLLPHNPHRAEFHDVGTKMFILWVPDHRTPKELSTVTSCSNQKLKYI